MFSWLINIRESLCTSNNAVVEPDPTKEIYRVLNYKDAKENIEITYDKLEPNRVYNNYFEIISQDRYTLSHQELAEINEKDPVYVAIKYTLVGAFFASNAGYPKADYNYDPINHYFTKISPSNFVDSGIALFMYIKITYARFSNKLLIFDMMKNHQDMISKIEQIALQLTTIITAKEVIISKKMIESIVRDNLTNYIYIDGKKIPDDEFDWHNHCLIEKHFSKSFIDTEYNPIDSEKLTKLNNVHSIAKCLLIQFLFDCWKIEVLKPEIYTATLVKSINTLLNYLGLDFSFTAETLKITDIDILKTEKQEEKEDEAGNIYPNSREIILNPEYVEVKAPETTDLNLKLADKDRIINSTISSKPVELDKASGKPVDLSQLLGFLGPDNDPDSCTIDISSKPTESKQKSYIFDWIKIIEAKDVREYLLSLTPIKNLQNATVKMQDSTSHVQKTDWRMDFASRDDPSDNDDYYRLEQQAKVSLHSCELQQTVLDYM